MATPMTNWNHRLFSAGDLADYLIDRWNLFLADLETEQRRSPEGMLESRIIADLEAKHRLTVPATVIEFRLVEHGKIADGKLEAEFDMMEPTDPDEFESRLAFIDAQLEYLKALARHTAQRIYVIMEVPFEGDGALLRYRPSNYLAPLPQGLLVEHSIRLRYERSGPYDQAWESAMKDDLVMIDEFLERTKADVAGFNDTVRKTARDTAPSWKRLVM